MLNTLPHSKIALHFVFTSTSLSTVLKVVVKVQQLFLTLRKCVNIFLFHHFVAISVFLNQKSVNNGRHSFNWAFLLLLVITSTTSTATNTYNDFIFSLNSNFRLWQHKLWKQYTKNINKCNTTQDYCARFFWWF